ncbi:hypothetical protein ACP70R_039964 [Stipagrostis hirtigluma subsp. patula]
MLASICRRRLLLRLRQIPAGSGTHPAWADPSDGLPFHCYSSTAIAGAPGSEPCPATVSYLASCGLTPAAAAAAGMLRFCSTAKAGAVLALFRRYGFSEAEISDMVRRVPVILTLDPDRILRPKLDLFASIGVQPCKLATTPLLLTRSLDNHLVPAIQFLRGILGTDRDVCRAISRTPRALMADPEKNMHPAVETLRRLGIPEYAVSKILMMEMGVLMVSPDRLSEIFEALKALGLHVTGKGFLYGFRAFCCLSKETWLRKLALYRSFGVSEDLLCKAIKTQPSILLYSDEGIKKKLRFFLDELKLEVSDLMGAPVLIGYSLEKNTKPRCAVLSILMREGKIEPDINIRNALLGSAKMFSEKYVLRYAQDVPDVVKAYEGKITFDGFKDRGVLVPQKT